MDRTVSIPEQGFEEMVDLAYDTDEKMFAAIYLDNDDIPEDQYWICNSIVVGEGNEKSVGKDPGVDGALRRLRNETDFDWFIGHTHGKGTIDNYGKSYATSFSGSREQSTGDWSAIHAEQERRNNQNYFEILITPGEYEIDSETNRTFYDIDGWRVIPSEPDVEVFAEDWSDDDDPLEPNLSEKTWLGHHKDSRRELERIAENEDLRIGSW